MFSPGRFPYTHTIVTVTAVTPVTLSQRASKASDAREKKRDRWRDSRVSLTGYVAERLAASLGRVAPSLASRRTARRPETSEGTTGQRRATVTAGRGGR